SGTSSSQGTTGAGNRTQPGSAETTAHQPGAAGTGDGAPGGGHSDPSTAPGRPGGSPHGVSYGKQGGVKEVPLFAGIGLFNTALGRWLSSFKVKASTKAALDGASILAAVFTGVTSFVAKLAKKAVRAGTKALGGAFRRFRRPGAARGGDELLLDTNVVISHGKNYAGKNAVKLSVTDLEIGSLVRRGKLRGAPGAAGDIANVGPGSLDSRINVRGLLKNGTKGNFADGVIGGTALDRGSTLVSSDKALRRAVEALGGKVVGP
ncbi:MAG: hypothetical protein MJE77_17550, partial [Proteobacteria bacterium]|nr:hypothetical protein [Pseudomonadota bacterium]